MSEQSGLHSNWLFTGFCTLLAVDTYWSEKTAQNPIHRQSDNKSSTKTTNDGSFNGFVRVSSFISWIVYWVSPSVTFHMCDIDLAVLYFNRALEFELLSWVCSYALVSLLFHLNSLTSFGQHFRAPGGHEIIRILEFLYYWECTRI